jgi:hypothetical protein
MDSMQQSRLFDVQEASSISDVALVIGCIREEDATFRRDSNLWRHFVGWIKSKHASFVQDRHKCFAKFIEDGVVAWIQSSRDDTKGE